MSQQERIKEHIAIFTGADRLLKPGYFVWTFVSLSPVAV